MNKQLEGKKVAILVTDGFEQSELEGPRLALDENGALTHIVSSKDGSVRAWRENDWGREFSVDKALSEVDSSEYDALLLPGGIMNPDNLRRDEKAVTFARKFIEEGKPIAAICHAPSLLIETDSLQGREVTSFDSIKSDLKNAGARWVDMEVVVDQGLVTSRSPGDLDAFNAKMVEEFREGIHKRNRTA